jgi:hypothetical protein
MDHKKWGFVDMQRLVSQPLEQCMAILRIQYVANRVFGPEVDHSLGNG